MNTLTPLEIESLTVPQLRDYVRENGCRKSWVGSAKKDALLEYLRTGTEPADNAPADLAAIIGAAVAAHIPPSMDEERVLELIQTHAKIEKKVLNIHLPEGKTVEIDDRTHAAFPRVLRKVAAGLPVLLVGPAGTGKTTLAAQVAKALDRSFSYNSMSAGCSEAHLLGRVLPDADGNWTYKESPFVRTYRTGGVHLFDEIDAADPNLMVVINAALANGHLSLPFLDTIIERHPDTVIIGAANTYGTGASRQYVGRNALDAATLDRFSVSTLEIGYDTDLERDLAAAILGADKAAALLSWAHQTREKIHAAGLRRIMSTRTITNAARLISTGETLQEVKADYFTGWTDDEKRRVAA